MSSDKSFLPYGRHLIDDEDKEAVARVLDGDWLTSGPATKEFENGLRTALDAPHAVACANGTAALHLATLALGIGPGDTVIVPAMTFLATANVARYVGADVKFADVDPDTGLLTPDALTSAIREARNSRLKAVFPVHLNGQTVDCRSLFQIAQDEGLAVVEDACHALGTTYIAGNGKSLKVGTCQHSDVAAFSFHPVKTIAMGEGGAVTTRQADIAERIERLRNHGMIRDATRFENKQWAYDDKGDANPWYYEMPEIGFNYRASDLNCALGASQLRKLDRFAQLRRALAAEYDKAFQPFVPAIRPVPRTPGCNPVLHLYVVLIDFRSLGASRSEVMNELHRRGIGTQVHYLPVNRQPYYRILYGNIALPGADSYYDRCLSIPYHVGMSPDDVARVVGDLADVLGLKA